MEKYEALNALSTHLNLEQPEGVLDPTFDSFKLLE